MSSDAQSPDVIPTATISLAAARKVVDAALAEAERLGKAVCICVTDPSGAPVATVRMDGAPRLSAGIAENKAFTCASFNGLPTHLWWGLIQDEPALVHGITHTPRLTIFGGGAPIMASGQLVGAVGASGGSAEDDRMIAEAGASAISG